MPLPLGFTGARLDRADRLRTDAEAFAAATQDPRATCLAMDGIDPVPGERGGLIWEPLDPADELRDAAFDVANPAATSRNELSAASRCSMISCCNTSGGGRSSRFSRLSSFSQKMSRFSLSSLISSS